MQYRYCVRICEERDFLSRKKTRRQVARKHFFSTCRNYPVWKSLLLSLWSETKKRHVGSVTCFNLRNLLWLSKTTFILQILCDFLTCAMLANVSWPVQVKLVQCEQMYVAKASWPTHTSSKGKLPCASPTLFFSSAGARNKSLQSPGSLGKM